jgi:hypothetical protein
MKLTVGPLPPAVYWRRRAALGAALLAVLLGFTTCVAGGSDAAPTKAAPKQTASSAVPVRSAAPAVAASPSSSPAGSPTPAAAAPAAIAPAPVAPRTGGGVPRCADADLRLLATLDRTSWPSGSMPKVHLVVRNIGSVTCQRDLGANEQELRVMAGTRRVWSSDDCQPLRGSSMRSLSPGSERTYTLTWSGKDSTPGCAQTRTRVEPGQYGLLARLGTLVSARTPFSIT